jgi:hypothetical protein
MREKIVVGIVLLIAAIAGFLSYRYSSEQLRLGSDGELNRRQVIGSVRMDLLKGECYLIKR